MSEVLGCTGVLPFVRGIDFTKNDFSVRNDLLTQFKMMFF